MTKLENKKTGEHAVIIKENKKTKTVMIELSDGKTKEYSTSTIKRHWKVLEEVKENKTTEKPAVKTTEKPAVSDEKKEAFVQAVYAAAEKKGLTIKTRETAPNRFTVKNGNRAVIEVCLGRKGYRLNARPELMEEKTAGTDYAESVNVIKNAFLPAGVTGIDYKDKAFAKSFL